MIPPILWHVVDIPNAFYTTECVAGSDVTYGGDIRIGDLRNSGHADFLVYRSVDDAHDGRGMKPCFMGLYRRWTSALEQR